MKRILLFCLCLFTAYISSNAQCAACTPVDCSAIKPTGGLCDTLPDDTAGQAYDAVISFYMPSTLTDPTTLGQCGGCSSVTLRRIDIVGVQGLPPGLSWTASDNGSYDVQGGTHFGCVRFCGTPVAPGIYYITVNLLADVTANGVPVIGSIDANDQAQQYRDTIEIFPGVGACPGTFSLGSGPCITTACNAVNVDLDGTLANQNCPNLISYAWDLGNGQTFNGKTPGVVNYTTAGTYTVTLTTTFYTYRVKSVTANVTGGYSGDVEELTSGSSPEPYIKINSLAFENRGGASGNTQTWNNLDLVIPDGNCDDQLEIQVWEEDTGPPQGTNPFGSQDDQINTHYVQPGVGGQVISMLNNSTIAVTFDTVATSSVVETIQITVNPLPPVPTLMLTNDSICTGDSTLLYTAEGLGEGFQFQWYLNDTTELPTSDSAIYVTQAGKYTLKITNLTTGCSAMSADTGVIFATGAPAPTNVNILNNGTQLFVSPFPTGFSTEWYFNTNLVAGQTGKFLPLLGAGTYSAVVYNTLFPGCRTESSQYILTGIEDISANINDVNVYPNPNTGKFNVAFSVENNADVKLSVQNMVGQVVYERSLPSFSGNYTQEMDMSSFGKGVYIVNVESNATRINKRVVVQ
jgi:hypothetical protein